MTPSSLRDKALFELREFAVLSIYLWICFGALLFYKSALLRAEGVAFLPLGFAALKAVVSAKFIMLGDLLRIAENRAAERLIIAILRKALALLVLLAALTLIEEGVLALIHGRPLSEALMGLGGTTGYQIAATLLIMLLMLFPYVAFRAIAEGVGERDLLRLLIRRAEPDLGDRGQQ
jgi:hypothetical protein